MTQQPRKILRCVHERADDLAHGIAAIDPYLVSHRQRKKVEMLSLTSGASSEWIV